MKPLRFLVALMLLTPAASAIAGELGGSVKSLKRAKKVAKSNDFTFLRTAADVRELVQKGKLVQIAPTSDFILLGNVSFPYARPAVKLFIERLAAQYRAATGDRLVVTSLTRPITRQPRNASTLSVHPAGMAVDFRIPKNAAHRKWLEKALLSLEDQTVLDVTRERRPAHYHVAVFPREYERYLAALAENSGN